MDPNFFNELMLREGGGYQPECGVEDAVTMDPGLFEM